MNQFPNEHKAIQQLKELSELDYTYNWTKQLYRVPKTANSKLPRKQYIRLPSIEKTSLKLPLQEISFNMNNLQIFPKYIKQRIPTLKPHTAKHKKQREN